MEGITSYLSEQGSLDVSHTNSSSIVEDICTETDEKATEPSPDTGADLSLSSTGSVVVKLEDGINHIDRMNESSSNDCTEGEGGEEGEVDGEGEGEVEGEGDGDGEIQHCPFPACQKEFTSRWSLTRHIRTHTGEKPFKCTICGKEFVQKCTLKRHANTHTQEKQWICDHVSCGKRFKLKEYLDVHKRTHVKLDAVQKPPEEECLQVQEAADAAGALIDQLRQRLVRMSVRHHEQILVHQQREASLLLSLQDCSNVLVHAVSLLNERNPGHVPPYMVEASMRLSDIVNISHGGQSLLHPHGQNHGYAGDGFENQNANLNQNPNHGGANGNSNSNSNSNNHRHPSNGTSNNGNSENGVSNSHINSHGRTGRSTPNNISNSNSTGSAVDNIFIPTSNTTANPAHTTHTTHSNIPTSVGTMDHLQFSYAANLAIRRLNGTGLGLIHPHGISDQLRDRDHDRDNQGLGGNSNPSHGEHTHHTQNLGGGFLPHPPGTTPRIYLSTPGSMSGLNLLGVNNLLSALGGSAHSRGLGAGTNSNNNDNNNNNSSSNNNTNSNSNSINNSSVSNNSNNSNNSNLIYISSSATNQSNHNVSSMPNYFRE